MATSGNLRWEALFGIKVIDTDSPSHHNRPPESVLESGVKENRIYELAVVERRGIKLYTKSDACWLMSFYSFVKRLAANTHTHTHTQTHTHSGA